MASSSSSSHSPLSSPPTIIRPITRADLPSLKALITATDLFPSELLEEMTAAFFSAGGTGDGGEFWFTVVEDGGDSKAVAYCAPEKLTEGTWNLLLIAVHPAFQGRGFGGMLLSHVGRVLEERGQRLLLVETSGLPAFEQTRRFYEKSGYEQEARIRDYYQAGEDKVIFRKLLFPPQERSTI